MSSATALLPGEYASEPTLHWDGAQKRIAAIRRQIKETEPQTTEVAIENEPSPQENSKPEQSRKPEYQSEPPDPLEKPTRASEPAENAETREAAEPAIQESQSEATGLARDLANKGRAHRMKPNARTQARS
jgi:hypothetical protein